MDAEWCIVCDTKILASNETCASSAYCSSDCFIAAHVDAASRPPSSSAIYSPVSAYPRPIYGSSLPHQPPRKLASAFTFSGAGLGELSLNSSSQTQTVLPSTMATSTFSLKPVLHHNLAPRVRLDALYPTHSVALNLEQLWTRQFLRASQSGSSPKSDDLSCRQPLSLPNFNDVPGVQALHQTAYIIPDEEASEVDPDEPHKHLDLELINLGVTSHSIKKTTNTKTKTARHESRRSDGERGRSGKIRSMSAAVFI